MKRRIINGIIVALFAVSMLVTASNNITPVAAAPVNLTTNGSFELGPTLVETTELGKITGHKYRCDTSDNCTQEGLGGWTINLTGPVSATTTTDNTTGYYEFTGLPDGTYTVTETLKPGWENCTPTSYQITLCNGQQVVVSDTNTMVTAGNSTPPDHAAVYAWEPYSDTDPSVWDNDLTGHAFSCGADWIWESYRPVNPVDGDVVEFERTFDIPGTPTGGTLYITCDNGYEVYMNGTFVGSAQLGAGWETSNLTQGFVDTDNWQSVETYQQGTHFSLQKGANILVIKAANEYMGALDGQADGTPDSNPAGLIYELFYDSDVNFCNRELGSITIIKDADPADGTDFNFTGDLGSFTLDDAVPDDSDGILDTITFSNLTWGDYDVTEIVPAGWTLDNINCTGGDSTPIADGVTVHLDPGEDITVTFTDTKLCEITGHKYRCDTSGNCTQEGLGGWTINLTGPVSATTTTDNTTGYYEFTDLPDGTYTVSETLQDGWTNCTPASYQVTLDDCQIHGQGIVVSDTDTLVTAGNLPGATYPYNAVEAWEHPAWSATKSTFSSGADWIWESEYVLNPTAGDTVQFQRSFYVPGTPTGGTLRITADNSYTVKLNGTTLGSDGTWQNVVSYDVSAFLLNSNLLEITAANQPTTGSTSTENPAGLIYELSYEFDADELNFCNRGPSTDCSISGHKYLCDVSDNCTQEGLEGWTINLTGPVSDNTTTDDNGYYEFTDLPDGTYTVSEVPKPGWVNYTPTSYQVTLQNCGGHGVVVSDNNTVVTMGNGATPHNAVYAWEPYLNDPNPPDPNNSHWDQGVSTTHVFGNGADWIWESYRVVHPVFGDVVEFQFAFYIPGNPTGGALYITCDNGYELYVNGSLVGSALVHDTPGQDWETSNLTETYVNTTGWQTVQSYHHGVDFSLQSGINLLVVKAANEYMGQLDNQQDGDIYHNPAGLIYELLYQFDTTEINFCNRQLGTITIVKEVIGDAPESDWEFTSDNITDFSIAAPGGSHTSDNLTPGTYTITETTKTGYAPSVNCTDCDNCTTDGDSVTIDLGPGDNVTCTFTNTKLGTIIIEKQTVPDGASDNFTFTGDVAGTISDGQQIQVSDLLPGQYAVTETVPAAWDLTNIAITEDKTSNSTSSNTTATIELDPGESVTVTFTNTKKETSILVEKVALPTTAAVGETITYTYTVTNTGQVTTDNITLVDDMLGIILLEKTTLAPGESTQSTGGPYTYTVTTGDLGGPIINVATANGTYPVNNQISANATASVTPTLPPPSPSGLGGTGTAPVTSPCPLALTVNVLGNTTTATMTLDGVLCQDCVALGPQGEPIWEADAGTKLTLVNNKVPRLIKLGLASSPPPPSNAAVVGSMYELNAYASMHSSVPYPVTISPPCRLVLPYDPDELPDNTSAILIAYYDEELGKWVDVETAGYVAGGVEAPNVLTSQVGHFTTFAVLAKLAAQAPAKTTEAPASTAQVAPETAEQPSSAINWWLIGGIIAVVLALAIWLTVRRRQLRGY